MGKQDEILGKGLNDEFSDSWSSEDVSVAADSAEMRKADLNARRKLEEYREKKAMQELLDDFDTYSI